MYYAHVPKDEKQKLDLKSQKCVLATWINYGTKTKHMIGVACVAVESGC